MVDILCMFAFDMYMLDFVRQKIAQKNGTFMIPRFGNFLEMKN